jgi:hypothetical protein
MNDSTKKIQTKRTFEAFKEQPKTMLEVAKETGILRGNICRYVAHFRKHRKIVEVKQGACPISHHKAKFYSTDPKHFPAETELELFPPTTKSRVYQL